MNTCMCQIRRPSGAPLRPPLDHCSKPSSGNGRAQLFVNRGRARQGWSDRIRPSTDHRGHAYRRRDSSHLGRGYSDQWAVDHPALPGATEIRAIPEDQRDPTCPIKYRVDLRAGLLGSLARPAPLPTSPDNLRRG